MPTRHTPILALGLVSTRKAPNQIALSPILARRTKLHHGPD